MVLISLKREDYVVNKSELVKALAEKAEITQKDAAKALDAVVETVQQALSKGVFC
jgi:DNA-binding protein HU-beta